MATVNELLMHVELTNTASVVAALQTHFFSERTNNRENTAVHRHEKVNPDRIREAIHAHIRHRP